MTPEYYLHSDRWVAVVPELKGRNKEVGLCHHCDRFRPSEPKTNCPTASALFALCQLGPVTVTLVTECAAFEPKAQ